MDERTGSGPMPETWRRTGDMIAPAARMTSLEQVTFRRMLSDGEANCFIENMH